MSRMHGHRIEPRTLALLTLAIILSLVARTVLQLKLQSLGMSRLVASDLSYLVVPAVLLLLMIPAWKSERSFILSRLRLADLTWRAVVVAIAIGVLLRVAWWSAVFARTAFGLFRTEPPQGLVGPEFWIQCEPVANLALGLMVVALLVPVIEEVFHRGYVFTATLRFGLLPAILLSAVVFAAFHKPGTWPVAFATGIVFATQYWRTGSLWSSTISHATFNAIHQFDWRCLRGYWNPTTEQLPVAGVGSGATVAFLAAAAAIIVLLTRETPGARTAPGVAGSE